jgi:ankyrin repeat protein
MKAVANRHTHILSLLISCGGSVNSHSVDGQTALMIAASRGTLECIQVLVVNGADLDAVSLNGDTAFSLAQSRGHTDCAEYLQCQLKVLTNKVLIVGCHYSYSKFENLAFNSCFPLRVGNV